MRRYESQTYALLRIVAGFLFLWHGLQLIFSFPAASPSPVPPFVTWIAGPIELVGGALVMIGLYCFTFLFIAARGPGIWSADAARGV